MEMAWGVPGPCCGPRTLWEKREDPVARDKRSGREPGSQREGGRDRTLVERHQMLAVVENSWAPCASSEITTVFITI